MSGLARRRCVCSLQVKWSRSSNEQNYGNGCLFNQLDNRLGENLKIIIGYHPEMVCSAYGEQRGDGIEERKRNTMAGYNLIGALSLNSETL